MIAIPPGSAINPRMLSSPHVPPIRRITPTRGKTTTGLFLLGNTRPTRAVPQALAHRSSVYLPYVLHRTVC